jgi:hypothetical protein
MRGLDGVDVGGQPAGGLQVEELPGNVLRGDLDVVSPLTRRELGVQLAGLRVDEVGRELAGVAPEQGVRQRAVTPIEPGQMEADEQLGQRVQQARAQVGKGASGKQRPVRQRERQVSRDQQAAELLALVVLTVGDGAERLHGGHVAQREGAQQLVFAQDVPVGGFLDREDLSVRADEAHHVPGDAARHLDDA